MKWTKPITALLLAAAMAVTGGGSSMAFAMTDADPAYTEMTFSSESTAAEAASEAESPTAETETESASPGINTLSVTEVNPLYTDILTREDIEQQLSATQSADEPGLHTERSYRSAAGSTESCTSVEEAGAQVRASLKEREETITVAYQMTAEPTVEIMSQIFKEALIHTGVPTEGDYLRWQYGGWKGSLSWRGSSQNGEMVYDMTITYSVVYYTSPEQEQEMDAAVSALLNQLDLTGKSSYEKVRTIYDYICANTVYDYTNLENSAYMLKYTAYAALIDKTSVCQGYAVLFYRLALEAGVDARVATGLGNGEGHAWNIVKIGKNYYNLDATWDAGNSNYVWFLRGTDNFHFSHVPEAETVEMEAGYHMSATDYDPQEVVTIFDEMIAMLEAAGEGEVVSVDLSGVTELPSAVWKAFQGRNVTLDGTVAEGIRWSICGSSIVSGEPGDIDISMTRTAVESGSIPADTITALAGSRTAEQLMFGQSGDFGFTGQLTLEVPTGIIGNKSIWLNSSADGALTYVASAPIADNNVIFQVKQGTDSAVIYGTNGDTSGDDIVDIRDLMQMLYHVSGRTDLNPVQQGFGDIDGDIAVSLKDLMRELYYVSGRNDSL